MELFRQLLDIEHLSWVERTVFGAQRKFVLVNQTLARSIRMISQRFGVLKNLAAAISGKPAPAIAVDTPQCVIYNGFSFSRSVSNNYLTDLARLMSAFFNDR